VNIDSIEDVRMLSKTARDVLKLPLGIPQYQRAYIWREATVRSFLADIICWTRKNGYEAKRSFHLGSIILKQDEKGEFQIVDGQQRLVTLSILADRQNIPANDNCLIEKQVRGGGDAIKRARNICQEMIGVEGEIDFDRLEFSVLEISQTAENELAYAFFDNTNTLGKKLSDYDLLKTHHLRFVEEHNQGKCAEGWHQLSKCPSVDGDLPKRLLNDILYRVRNWDVEGFGFPINGDMTEWHELFNHFRSVVDDSRLHQNQTQTEIEVGTLIVGGESFFNYIEYYRGQYLAFMEEESAILLRKMLSGHSGGVIYNVIIALGFVAYCRFGGEHIADIVMTLAYVLSKMRKEGRVQERMIAWRTWGGFVQGALRKILHAPSDVVLVEVLGGDEYRYEPGKANEGSRAYAYWYALKDFLVGCPGTKLAHNSTYSDRIDLQKIKVA